MALSKKEIATLIDIIYSIVFAFVFLPYFYKNQELNLNSMEGLKGVLIQIVISTVIYFSIAYAALEVFFKKKENTDERDDMIHSKSYKLGYWLYEFSIVIIVGYIFQSRINRQLFNLQENQILDNSVLIKEGEIIFLSLLLLAGISVIKSSYQFYLQRTH
ncbi:MAG: hypothetical protein CMC18_04570 [Flavobacteriaceae bacterium]|nr:hypothetical protein [Flavobacteriaceae bacterium]